MKEAKQIVKRLIKGISLDGLGFYQGVIDIGSSCINFQEIGKQNDLTIKEYENLIEYAQKEAEKKLTNTIM